MTLHTFVVLAYRDSPYLSECLESLMHQTEKSEILVSTSTPSRHISDTAGKYGVNVLISQDGSGIAHDWNFGWNCARTKYVTLAHQDDSYAPDYTSHCLRAVSGYTDALFCFTDYSEIVHGKERKHTRMLQTKRMLLRAFMPFRNSIRSPFWKSRSQSLGNSISCPTVMYNKSMLPGFRFSSDYKINLDWDAWLRMAGMEGRFVYVPEILVGHRIHGGSETTAGLKANDRQLEDFELFCRLWPRPVAKLLAAAYAGSYHSNKI